MSKVLVSKFLLDNIADAVRNKTGKSGSLTLQDIKTDIDNLNIGISNSSQVRYRFGAFYGYATCVSDTGISVRCITPGHEKAVIIVIHRGTIELPSGWTMLHQTKAPLYDQWVTILYKDFNDVSNNLYAENIRINQNKTGICAATMYFALNTNIAEPIQQEFDTGQTAYKYTIPTSEYIYLCIINHVYAGNATLSVNSAGSSPIYYLPEGTSSATRRTGIFIANSSSYIEYIASTTAGDNDRNNNRLYLYKLSCN